MNEPNKQPTQKQHPRNDVFVGNLSFNTTEEQLHQSFSELGRILKVRLVTDIETGRPRGFAFIEFEDPQAALSAIRNMNDYEINGRKIRVNFSNSSHLETLADKLGMDVPINSQPLNKRLSTDDTTTNGTYSITEELPSSSGTDTIVGALKSMCMSDMYNIIKKLKEIADRDPDEVRKIIGGHPQISEAILYIMSRLEMLKSPLTTNVPVISSSIPRQPAILSVSPDIMPIINNSPKEMKLTHSSLNNRAADPRAALGMSSVKTANTISSTVSGSQVPSTTTCNKPRPADPRTLADPRNLVRQNLPLNQMQQSQQKLIAPQLTKIIPSSESVVPPMLTPPPPVPPLLSPPLPPLPTFNISSSQSIPKSAVPQPVGLQNLTQGVASLDLSLIQQVMELTPSQISLLPVDKQQSIIELRKQITNSIQQNK